MPDICENMKADEIIKRGWVEVHVTISGMRQLHKLTVIRESSAFGSVISLVAKTNIPLLELARLSKELQLPVKSPLGVAFPPGRMMKDFVEV